MSSSSIEDFFKQLDRSYFMDILKEESRLDCAIPIGYGQTISQPSLVLFMTKALMIEKHHRILEIGTGSGYQTTFLAEFGEKVYTIERIEALYESAKDRLSRLGYTNIEFFLADGSYGLKEFAPYDRIMVTAAARKIPQEYLNQLAVGGRMIIPVGDYTVQKLLLVEKDSSGDITEKHLENVRFVPLVGAFEI